MCPLFMSRRKETAARRKTWENKPRHEREAIRHNLFRAQLGICPICERPLDEEALSVDHKRSCARGGTSEIHNLRVVHFECNAAKASGTDAQARERLAERGLIPAQRSPSAD